MRIIYLCYLLILMLSCQGNSSKKEETDTKSLIIESLKKETQYFCERNLEKWQEQWSQAPFVSKMYAGTAEFEEFDSWEEINQFTVDHINENPDPIPIPQSDQEYKIYVLGKTAWVFFNKIGEKGLVKETRFMVKENRKWKIARMQTIF